MEVINVPKKENRGREMMKTAADNNIVDKFIDCLSDQITKVHQLTHYTVAQSQKPTVGKANQIDEPNLN